MTWGETLLGRTGRQCAPHGLLKDIGGPVSRQRPTPSAGEQDAVATFATLSNPGPQRTGSSRPQGDTAFLAALALEAKERGRSEGELMPPQSEDF
jgi:hypothetical protein